MNVGDYVRTINGIIAKIESKRDYTTGDYIGGENDFFLNVNHSYQDYDRIVKSSPNIIDLIEENDLITIEYYSLRYSERVTRLFEVTYKDDEYIVLDNAKCSFMLKNNDFNRKDKQLEPIIKSIVTKEQFSQMEYKVGD